MGKPTIIDISPPISETTAVWPGDQAFSRSIQCQLSKGHNIDLSSMSTTVHIGAHADAPSHYEEGQPSIDKVDLEPYIGPCVVVDLSGVLMIEEKHCMKAVASGMKRILFKTGTQPDSTHFNTEFSYFSKDAIHALGNAGVLLIGIDTASVDEFSSKDLPAHHELLKWKMRNLEGLDLSRVEAGSYELIALPLKLVGFDASPVRAILRPL